MTGSSSGAAAAANVRGPGMTCSEMHIRDRRSIGVAGVVAVVLGSASAAVSLYWLLGGRALLDTVGGEIERWGRERGAAVLLALAGVVLVKLFVAVIPAVPAMLSASGNRLGRMLRVAGWIAAVVLVIYGGLLTVVGLLVQADVIHASADADPKALAWHAYLWDPWFLVWGIALLFHLRRSRLRDASATRWTTAQPVPTDVPFGT